MRIHSIGWILILAIFTLAPISCNDDAVSGGDTDTPVYAGIDGDDEQLEDGDVTDGDSPDGDITDGDVSDGDVTDGDTLDGDMTDGDVTDGDTTDGDATDGDVTDGDEDQPVCEGAKPLRCDNRFTHSTVETGRADQWRAYSCTEALESGREVVYDFKSDASCHVTLQLSNYNTDLDIFVLTECDPFSCMHTAIPSGDQHNEALDFDSEAGRSYAVVVDGYNEAEGSYTLSATCDCDQTDGDLEPVDCSPIDARENWDVCSSNETSCEAVFTDSAGCAAVCRVAGLECARVFENVDDQCAADIERPELCCDPSSGHQSDYCVCVSPDCEPDCDSRECGYDGCSGSCGECSYFPNSFCDNGTCRCRPDTCETSVKVCGLGHDNGCGSTFDCPPNCTDGSPCIDGICSGPRCEADNCPAFPGAQGEGMYAVGGRGGDVCHVTNTDNNGPGSLRNCVAGSGPRTVVFDTGGIITLESSLRIDRSYLTLAGQTAPGDGITIRGYTVSIRGEHTIVQHLRFRAGDIRKMRCPGGTTGFTEDSFTINADNVIVDHVSASWGIDESLSASDEFHDVTVQYCIIAEGLYQTGLWHGECNEEYNPGGSEGHSMGSLFKPDTGDMNISIHHNLYAHNNNRNPAVGTYETDQDFKADIRNNVIYDCPGMGYTSGASGRGRVNYVGNFAVWGPVGDDDTPFQANGDNNVDLYQQDNRLDKARDHALVGIDWGWTLMGGDYNRESSPHSMKPVTTHASANIPDIVLTNAGARPWNRDEPDKRIIASVRNNTGGLIDSQDEVGGWGTVNPGEPVVDTDRDGMPDDWESSYGTDPDVADNNGDRDNDGYTNLEEYLHWASRWPR